MTAEFRASFARDLRTIRDADLLARIQAAIEVVEQAERLQDIPNLIKCRAAAATTDLRIGDHRLGLSITDNIVAFVRCLNRREIYKNFP
jgi:mRNA interferase RelE/StbE